MHLSPSFATDTLGCVAAVIGLLLLAVASLLLSSLILCWAWSVTFVPLLHMPAITPVQAAGILTLASLLIGIASRK